jgi:hypothetical protein
MIASKINLVLEKPLRAEISREMIKRYCFERWNFRC